MIDFTELVEKEKLIGITMQEAIEVFNDEFNFKKNKKENNGTNERIN